jgi:hypothetical protein
VNVRRLAITFFLLVNSAALILAIITFTNGSPVSDVTSEDVTGASGLLVIAESDASLATILAFLGIGGNLILGYLFLSHPDDGTDRREDGPRITGE